MTCARTSGVTDCCSAKAIRDKYPELVVVRAGENRIIYMEKGRPGTAVDLDARSWLVEEGAWLFLRHDG